jgi:Mce-associated membrane protein
MEGDAGTSQLNPTGGSDAGDDIGGQERSGPADATALEPGTSEQSEAPATEAQDQPVDGAAEHGADDLPGAADELEDTTGRRTERLGRGWLVGLSAVLLLLTAGVGAGGYLALRSHQQSEAIAREDAFALQRAKDCVSATQAPDVAAISASQSKIIECATGAFGVQANLFTSMLVEAYQAANVAVQVSDMRGAVEKHNDDGSVDVLVALRVKVTNSEVANQETGYRLRVQMAPVDGTYKIAQLDQVTS